MLLGCLFTGAVGIIGKLLHTIHRLFRCDKNLTKFLVSLTAKRFLANVHETARRTSPVSSYRNEYSVFVKQESETSHKS